MNLHSANVKELGLLHQANRRDKHQLLDMLCEPYIVVSAEVTTKGVAAEKKLGDVPFHTPLLD